MTIIRKMAHLFSKKTYDFLLYKTNKLKFGFISFNSLIVFFVFSLISTVFIISVNIVDKKIVRDKNNLKDLTNTSEFTNFSNYLLCMFLLQLHLPN